MDDFWGPLAVVDVVPYTGPVIRTADRRALLGAIDDSARRMRSGEFDARHTRRVLRRYLDDCRLLPFSSSYTFLEDAAGALVAHALSVPAGMTLDDGDWAGEVNARLSLEYARIPPCGECRLHFPDQLYYVYSVGRQLYLLDYFGRGRTRTTLCASGARVSSRYEQCWCGRWYRPVTVLE